MSSVLEFAVREGYERVAAAGNDRHEVVEALVVARTNILAAATPDVIEDALEVSQRNGGLELPDTEGMVVPEQGYLGRIVISQDGELQQLDIVSAAGGIKPAEEDPIQVAWGEGLYAAMVWPKALRAAAYLLAPRYSRPLTAEQYFGKLGFTLGSNGRRQSNGSTELYGATGWMPTEDTLGRLNATAPLIVGARLAEAELSAYRASGLTDQLVTNLAVSDTMVYTSPSEEFEELARSTMHEPSIDWN